MTNACRIAPKLGSLDETICHTAAAHPDWTGRKVADHCGCLPSMVSVALRKYGRRLRPDRRSYEIGFTDQEMRNVAKAAEKRGLDIPTMVERIARTCAAEIVLIENFMDDEVPE